MSAQRKAQRRLEIEAIRENAREAFAAGQHRSSCPYDYCNKYQWENEYDAQAMMAAQDREISEQRKAQFEINRIDRAIADVSDLDARMALELIFNYIQEK